MSSSDNVKFGEPCLDSESQDKINLEVLAKSISLIPDTILALVSSYMAIDNIQCSSFSINPESEQMWKQSITECLDKFLGEDIFLLKICVRNTHVENIVGPVTTYDLSICNSDEYSIPAKVLDLALRKCSLITKNGNMMLARNKIAMSYILNKPNDPNDNGTLTFIEKENIPNNSLDIQCIDSKNLFDTFFDRSYLFLGGCVNLLITLIQLAENMKKVSPHKAYELVKTENTVDVGTRNDTSNNSLSDLGYELKPFIRTDVHAVSIVSKIDREKSGETTQENSTNEVFDDSALNIFNSPGENNEEQSLNSSKNTESTKDALFPEEKGYNIRTHIRQIEKNIGIWGREDLYMKFLANLRGLVRDNKGFDSIVDKIDVRKQGNFGDYFVDTAKDDEDGDEPGKSTQKEKNNDSNSASFVEELRKQEKLMEEERRTYCSAIKKSIGDIFNHFSEYVNECLPKYKRSRSNNNSLRNSRGTLFKENMQRYNSTGMRSNNNSDYSEKKELKYKGSVDYEQTFNENTETRCLLNELMESTGMVPYFHVEDHKNLPSNIVSVENSIVNEESLKVLRELNMESFFSTAKLKTKMQKSTLSADAMDIDTDYENEEFIIVEIPCFGGIPVALLYDEESVLKLLMVMWRSKTKQDSLEFNNTENSSLPKLYTMVSDLWVAKSFVSLNEYEILAERYDTEYIEKFVLNSFKSKST